MTPVRWDPLTGTPLLVAPARIGRPHDTGPIAPGDPGPVNGPGPAGCPFCPGSEDETPPEVWAERPPGGVRDTPGWSVRAVPNRFPVLPPDEGIHEVVINSPRHVVELWELSAPEMIAAVDAWARRERVARDDPRGLWPFVFLNQGAAAGASLQHSHAQLIGFPFAPPLLAAREDAFERAPRCPVCAELMDPALARITDAGPLTAWCPQAPPLSGAIRIAPRRHAPEWPEQPGCELAGVLGPVMRALAALVGTTAMNLWVNQRHPGGPDAFHWHLEIIPRRATLAGMELAAGVFSLLNDPTALAAALRAQASATVAEG
jgi:UDPglucose--hexose-1-phosphate uridylyltransferase